MRRKEIPRTKKHTNKHFVIAFPDDIKEQYPELVRRIASHSTHDNILNSQSISKSKKA